MPEEMQDGYEEPVNGSQVSRTWKDLELTLHQLNIITRFMQIIGLAAVLVTFIGLLLSSSSAFNVFNEFISAPTEFEYGRSLRSTYQFLLTAVIMSVSCAIILVSIYEYLRKKGDVLFEEISDELRWDVSGKSVSGAEKPALEIRVTLRSFARAADLPLVPGKFGPVLYVLFNLTILLVQFVFPSILRKP